MSKIIQVKKTEYGRTFTSEVRMEGGVYVYATTGRVPPADTVVQYGIDKLPGFDKALHDRIRDEQTDRILADYRESMKGYKPSAEELFEMRAAFGPGATLVDVITGKKFKV